MAKKLLWHYFNFIFLPHGAWIFLKNKSSGNQIMSIEFIHFNAGCPGGNVFYVGCTIFAGLTHIFQSTFRQLFLIWQLNFFPDMDGLAMGAHVLLTFHLNDCNTGLL